MSSDLSQLDQISEADIVEALGAEPVEIQDGDVAQEVVEENEEHLVDTDELTNVPEELLDPVEESEEENIPEIEEESGEVVEEIGDIDILPLADIESAIENQEEEISLSPSSMEDLTNILGKLLNNKTIEITIKVKD